jgi:hypothetical protein
MGRARREAILTVRRDATAADDEKSPSVDLQGAAAGTAGPLSARPLAAAEQRHELRVAARRTGDTTSDRAVARHHGRPRSHTSAATTRKDAHLGRVPPALEPQLTPPPAPAANGVSAPAALTSPSITVSSVTTKIRPVVTQARAR